MFRSGLKAAAATAVLAGAAGIFAAAPPASAITYVTCPGNGSYLHIFMDGGGDACFANKGQMFDINRYHVNHVSTGNNAGNITIISNNPSGHDRKYFGKWQSFKITGPGERILQAVAIN